MSKLMTYLIILSGISLLLLLAGIPTETHDILGRFGVEPEYYSNNTISGLNFNNVSSSQSQLSNYSSSPATTNSTAGGLLMVLGFISAVGIAVAMGIAYLTGTGFIQALTSTFVVILGLIITADTFSVIKLSLAQGFIGYIIALVYIPLWIGMVLSLIEWWTGQGG